MTVAETDIPVAELTTSMVLTRALEILNATGWCQGDYETKDGRRCAIGAIRAVTLDPEQGYQACRALLDVTGTADWNVPLWNDSPATTWEDVQHAFNQAIKATTPKEEINGYS